MINSEEQQAQKELDRKCSVAILIYMIQNPDKEYTQIELCENVKECIAEQKFSNLTIKPRIHEILSSLVINGRIIATSSEVYKLTTKGMENGIEEITKLFVYHIEYDYRASFTFETLFDTFKKRFFDNKQIFKQVLEKLLDEGSLIKTFVRNEVRNETKEFYGYGKKIEKAREKRRRSIKSQSKQHKARRWKKKEDQSTWEWEQKQRDRAEIKHSLIILLIIAVVCFAVAGIIALILNLF